ncbi:MAG: glycosyltransferase family 39 protein [Anaerolineae bacterium]
MTIRDVHISLMSIATAILLFALLILLAYGYNLITFPYDYDQGEGFELVDTIMFSEFRYPYQNTDSYPYYSSNYPPLYHVLAVPFVWLFGAGYWYGRLLSLIATLFGALAIFYVVNREGEHRWLAGLSALAFLSSNTVYHIAPLFRQHIMMVMFEIIAVVILARAVPRQQNKSILLGLLLIIIAGYTKQLATFTAIAVLAWMVLRNPHHAIIWITRFVLAGGAIFLWLTIDTNGEWWRQAIVANVNQFNPFQTFGLTALWLRLHLLLIVPAVLMVLYELYFERLSLYSVWFVVTTVFGAFGSGTWGAGDSYFATSIAAMCILSGIFFTKLIQHDWSRVVETRYRRWWSQLQLPQTVIVQGALVIIPLLYIGYGVMTFKMPTDGWLFGTVATVLNVEPNVMGRHYDSAGYRVEGYANIGHFVTAEDHTNGDYIVERINQTDTPVMSEEAGFSLAAGRDVITNPTQLRNLWLNGMWNGDELIADIDDQIFGLIIFRAQFYPVPVLEAVGEHYVIDETVRLNGFEYQLLRPIDQ